MVKLGSYLDAASCSSFSVCRQEKMSLPWKTCQPDVLWLFFVMCKALVSVGQHIKKVLADDI